MTLKLPLRYRLSTVRTSTFRKLVGIGTYASIPMTAGPPCPQSSGSNSASLVVATGIMAAADGPMLIGSVGDHGITRHRFTGKKNNRIWCVVWMVHRVYHTILHLTVLSSTMTVDQTELCGVLTGNPAHNCEVGLAECRRCMRVPPLRILFRAGVFLGEATGAVHPLARRTHRGFSSSSRGVRPRRTERSTGWRRAAARASTSDHFDGDLK